MTDNGGPAFPIPRVDIKDNQVNSGFWEPGMSLRDWFAGMALQGILAAEINHRASISQNVTEAFDIADNMIKERAKRMA